MNWELWRLGDGSLWFEPGAGLVTLRRNAPAAFGGAELLWTCRAPTPEAATLLLREWLGPGCGPAAGNSLEPPAPGAVG
jgi:hypothetical protein